MRFSLKKIKNSDRLKSPILFFQNIPISLKHLMSTHNSLNPEEEENGFLNGYHAVENEPQRQDQIILQNNQNLEKNTFCFYLSIVLYLLILVNFTLFVFVLILKLDEDINWRFSKLSIAFYLGMFGSMLFGNILIIKNTRLFNNCLGKCFLQFCLNSAILMGICFGILLNLKLEAEINWEFRIVFVPLYMIMSIIFIFICFIFPGLVDSSVKMYKEAVFISSQYLACLLTMIILLFKLDQKIEIVYSEIFILEEIMLLLQFFSYFKFKADDSKYLIIENLVMHLSLLVGFICLGLKCDEILKAQWKFALIPFYFIFVGMIIKSIRIFLKIHKLNKLI